MLLALWLVVIQGYAIIHASKHSLVQDQQSCQLCNFAEHSNLGPSFALPVVTALMVPAPEQGLGYQNPQPPRYRRMPVRGPPA